MATNQKHEVLDLLQSLVKGQRVAATEKKLEALSNSAGYGMLLLSIFSNQNGPFDDLLRHQTGILLKNFITKKWEGGTIGADEKNAIKTGILAPRLFQDRDAGIRRTTALIVSALAELDYPEHWGSLLDAVLSAVSQAVSTRNVLLLSGSVEVLRFFVEHICDLQLPALAPLLFPLLLRICGIRSLDAAIRLSALSVYHQLLSIALEIRMIDANLTKRLINPTLLQWLQWINDDVVSSSDPALLPLQALCLRILNDVTKSYSLSIVQCLPRILGSTWKLMLFYSARRGDGDAASDEDAVHSLFDCAFCWILTILRHRQSAISSLLDDKLNDVTRLMLSLLHYGRDAVEALSLSPNDFLAAEETATLDNSLRGRTRCALLAVLEARPRTAYCSFLQSAKRVLSTSPHDRDREAALLVFGALAAAGRSKKAFVAEDFVRDVLCRDLRNTRCPLLRFRALSTLTKFVPSLPAAAAKAVVPAVCESMKSPHPLCVRFAAFKAFDAILSRGGLEEAAVDSLLDGVVPMLCHLLSKMDETTLKYGLKVLASTVRGHGAKCSQFQAEAIPLVLGLWASHCLSHDISAAVRRVIAAFAAVERCRAAVVQGVVPTIERILGQRECDPAVTGCALHILYVLMMHSLAPKQKKAPPSDSNLESGSVSGSGSVSAPQSQSHSDCASISVALEDVFFDRFLPRVLELVLSATDSAAVNLCARSLCLLIEHSPQRVAAGTLSSGQPVVEALCQVISRLLSSAMPEEASHGVGPLISRLTVRLKRALSDAMFADLLLTIIGRIDSCCTAALRNQLLLIFARLVLEYGEGALLRFLAEHRRSEEILTLWCQSHNDFICPYYKKVSAVALSKLLLSGHPDLGALALSGYPIINMHAPRASRSRSRSQPLRFTTMSFEVKFFQILVNTFRDLVATDDDEESFDSEIDDEDHPDYVDEVDYKTQTDDDDEEYDPDAEGDEDDESYDGGDSASDDDDEAELHHGDDRKEDERAKSISNPANRKSAAKDIELELCPEARRDQIFYMDFGRWATEFARGYSAKGQAFQAVISQLNDEDRRILKRIMC